MGRSVSRTTSSSVGSYFFTVSVNVLNAEPIAAVASHDSNPASDVGFAPACSPEVRGSVGGCRFANLLVGDSSAYGGQCFFHRQFLMMYRMPHSASNTD